MKHYFFLVLIILVISILACDGDLASLEKAEPTPVAEVIETETATPTPVLTPTPVPTPTLVMLTCADVERKRKELTDLQWEAYSREIMGEEMRFGGKIIDVYDDGSVQVLDRTCKNLLTVVKLHEIPLGVAAGLNKDQFIEGEGIVREVDIFLGLMIHIEVTALR